MSRCLGPVCSRFIPLRSGDPLRCPNASVLTKARSRSLPLLRAYTDSSYRTPAGNRRPSQLHKTLGFYPSETGRLIVVGDVHGCACELADLLNELQFDLGIDKLVFVGDLVNKGPRSRQVIQLAMQTGAQVVRGNHDDIALGAYLRQSDNPAMSWLDDLSADEVWFLKGLPFTVSIPTMRLLVVHAGMLPNIQTQHQHLKHLCTIRSIVIKDEIASPYDKEPIRTYYASQLRSVKDENANVVPWASMWQGPQHILFGHDAKRGLQKYNCATGLDTGCVYGGRLTACVIPILRGIEALGTLLRETVPTLDDLDAELVSVPARKVYLKPKFKD